MKILKVLSISISLALLISDSVFCATIKVPDDYATIQQAIDAAVNGDTVLVASGTFTGPIYFNGKKITVRSESGPNVTIIDGGAQFHGNETEESILEGFKTIGNVDISASSPTIKNCKLKGEGTHVDGGHGSIYSGSSPSFIGCKIYEGQAGVGGGYDVRDSSATFVDCEFYGNEASSKGGALFIFDSTVTIERCRFESNNAGESGGGIYITGNSSSEVINSNFNDNFAQGSGGGFSCLWNEGDVLLKQCSFSKNTTEQWGGAIQAGYNSSLTLDSCIISENEAGWHGGGIHSQWGASVTVANCIFFKNQVHNGSGGGIIIYGGHDNIWFNRTKIINCTFSKNNASHWGGAISGDGTTSIVTNSILWNNYAPSWPEFGSQYNPNIDTSRISFCNIDQDGFAGSNGNIRQDPLFVDPENGDVHLQYGSPCIDKGTLEGAPKYDIDGDVRPQGLGYDIGADEYSRSLINDLVTFEPDSSTYDFTPDTGGCQTGAIGKFTFDAKLTNTSEKKLSGLNVEVDEITNNNLLLTNHGLIGEGGQFKVPKIDDYTDGYLSPDEYVDVPFSVCLQDKKPFRFFVNVLGQSEVNITQTPWEMNMGEGIVPFGFQTPYYGWEGEYDFASIPPENDSGWISAPDPQSIDFSVVPSTLCDSMDCLYGAEFTYFQTFVDVPPGVEIKTFNIAFDGIDDGVQVRVFNSDNPTGGIAGYVFLGESKTIDLRSLIKKGEKNRIIVTQTDDCCYHSHLTNAIITIEAE